MPVPSPRNKILPARGNFADLSTNVASLLDGEICYAIDQDQYYQKEGGTLVSVGATKAQGILADSAVQPGDNISTLANDSAFVDASGAAAAAPVQSVASKTGNVTLVKADITDFSDADYATAAQGATADAALQPGDNVSDLTNDANYINAAGAPVQSVNSQTGSVVLGASDVGLGNVDNTSDADKPVSTAQQTALDTKADLVGGVIPTSQIPAIAITEFLGSVGSEAAMLALTGQPGDWCLRTDKAVGYVIIGADPSLIANWEAFTVPGSAVTTINTQVGDVVLGAADVGAATAAQGLLADSAVQPTDSIDVLADVDISTAAPTDGQALVWDNAGGKFVPGEAGLVDSVNGQTGVVSLDAADVGAATAAQGATADTAIQPTDSIDALSDVDTSTTPPTDGQALVWDNANGKWEPGAVSGGSSQWDDVTGGINYASGNVGIGQSTPTKLLDVNGDALINGLNIGRGAGSIQTNTAVGNNVLNANTTGDRNTGVGRGVLANNTIGGKNTAVGQSALLSNTEGTENTAVGLNSLQANITGDGNIGLGVATLFNNVTGSDNTAIGKFSLISNIGGNENTAIGKSVLSSLEQGSKNTALGIQALNLNITGNLNTAVGYAAGYYIEGSNNTILGAYEGTAADANLSNTVIISAGATERMRIDSNGNVGIGTTSPQKPLDVNGDALINGLNIGRGAGSIVSNTAVGASALNANTTGLYNTAIGQNVLTANTIGAGNTAIGQNVLNANTEGAANTGIGRQALQANTTGTGNTAAGRQALNANTEGGNNTAFGRQALQANVTGSFNTAVGRSAGFYIAGSNNTILGAYQGTSADATLSDTVIIAAGATERMRINSLGRLLVGYTGDNGNYKLQVNGQIFATSATIATSDGRYKENVTTLDGCVDLVKALRPVSFDWKEQQDITRIDDEGNEVIIREGHVFPDETQVGFIAQEVEEVLTDKPWVGSVIKQNVRPAVTDNDGNELAPKEEFLGIAEGNLVPLLTAALQEALVKIESLEQRLTDAGL